MSTRKKITLILIALFVAFFVSMVVIIMVNFRDYGIKSADERARLTAEIVKSGLTAHMVNGIMDKRAFFLEQIENVENIHSIWVARSPTVIKQFGEGFNNEIPRDNIDKKVLGTGKMERAITETASKSMMRVTMPFIATAFGSPNCLSCHDAQEGEVLGVVSMTFDITEGRGTSLSTALYTGTGAIIFILLVLYAVNRFLTPYVRIFYSVHKVMKNAYKGDYSLRVDGGSSVETKLVALMMNTLLEKLAKVFEEIDKKVYIFLKNKNQVKDVDPLVSINNTIEQLSEIYKFKQIIENDEELQDVYNRIAHVLETKFKLDDFTLIEINTLSKAKKIVYSAKGCHCGVVDGTCRADRINATVDSTIFDNVCDIFHEEGADYLCIPYSISNEMHLHPVLHLKRDASAGQRCDPG